MREMIETPQGFVALALMFGIAYFAVRAMRDWWFAPVVSAVRSMEDRLESMKIAGAFFVVRKNGQVDVSDEPIDPEPEDEGAEEGKKNE